MNPEICCVPEEEFENQIRVKGDVKQRITETKTKKKLSEDVGDPIEEADVKGRVKYQEEDEIFMRAAKLDLPAVLYLEERAKYCYPLKETQSTAASLENCFKDESRSPTECECEVRDYLRDTVKEKAAFSDNIAKYYSPKKTNKKKA